MTSPAKILIFVLAGVYLAGWAAGQNCGCAANLCCSQYGYCGSTDAYCGAGCRSGPCKSGGGKCNGGTSVQNYVTQTFFDNIKRKSPSNCAGHSFYTRSAFLTALQSYPCFAQEGSDATGKCEIAAMFAHFAHETGFFCYIEEINGATRNYCDASNTQWPCKPGKTYYGRGPIQISWNYNYGPAGQSIGFNGLNSPETVANDPVVAFKTGFWFWMNNVHSIFVNSEGFGASIRAINGMECNGGNPGAVNARVQYYKDYCAQLGVSPGPNLYC